MPQQVNILGIGQVVLDEFLRDTNTFAFLVLRGNTLLYERYFNGHTEADLSHYAVYRGTTADFVPGAGNLVGTSADTMLVDSGWQWDAGYYYKVSALDVHDNESGHAVLGPDNVYIELFQKP